MRPAALPFVAQLYAALSALLLPAALRRAYGASMVDLFADLYREGWSTRGWRGGVRVVGREMASLLRTAWYERRKVSPSRPTGGSVDTDPAVTRAGRGFPDPDATGPRRRRAVLSGLLDDGREAFRAIVRNPAMSIAVVVILAVGIGANTAIFSVLNTVLLRPLPYPDADRIVQVLEFRDDRPEPRITQRVELFRAVRERAETLDAVSGYVAQLMNMTGVDEPVRVDGWAVTASMFPMLGASPALGRVFSVDEEMAGTEPVVVLSHALWQQHFGGDPEIVGRSVKLDGTIHTIVGVLQADFDFLGQKADLWTPLVLSATRREGGRPLRSLHMFARLRDDTSAASAEAELNAGLDALRENPLIDALYPGRLRLVPLKERLVGGLRTELWMLQGAVALVLLIACSNIANLLLGRGAARRKEIAMRTALGCSRRRLVGQLLIESSMLALLAAAVGVLLALWGARALIELSPDDVPRMESIGLDPDVLLFTVLVALGTGLGFGLAPALRATGFKLQEALSFASSTGTSLGQRRLGNALVVSQIALALTLAIGAGLVANSLTRLLWVDPGYDPDNVATLQIDLPSSRYGSGELHAAFYDRLLARVGELAEVEAAGVANTLPLFGAYMGGGFGIEGDPEPLSDEEVPMASFSLISPGYFEALGIPLLRGNGLGGEAARDRLPAVVVNQALVDVYFSGREAIGRRLRLGGDTELLEIVGVVGNVRRALAGDAEPTVYISHRRMPEFLESKRMLSFIFLVARTAGDPRTALPQIRDVAAAIDPELPVYDLLTMQQRTWASVARERFYATLLGLFSSVALLLVAAGIYGVIAYYVSQRIPEIGVRVALGAAPGDVFRLVVGRGMLLTASGIGFGIVGALAATRLLSGLLFAITPTDPATFVAVVGLFAAVAALALWQPAHRAMRVDPMVALRRE